VQEYIEGQSLQSELLAKGKFSEPEVIVVLREVTRILEFVHFQGSIHRNIKPSKIRRDAAGKIHLVDFGAVKQINLETVDATGDLSLRNSKSGFRLEYTLPNQRLRQEIYPSSDLYSLAVTCLNLLTGTQPQNLLDSETNKWHWRTPDLQVSDALAEILDKMLQPIPIDRFTSARDVLDTLDNKLGTPILSIPTTNILGSSITTPSTLLLDNPYDDPFQIVDDFEEVLQLDRDIFQLDDRLSIVTSNKVPVHQDDPNSTIRYRSLSPDRKPLILGGIFAVGIMGLIAMIIPKLLLSRSSVSTMNSASDGNIQNIFSRHSSVGERILVGFEGNRDTDKFKELKRAGVLAISTKNYPEAVKNFQAALVENPNSPETRIYLNNALIGDKKSYTIAAAAPIERSIDRASEMLRGFAQAQAELNQVGGITEAKIKLKIIDDSDDPKTIESIASAVVKQPEILGIVGHSRNDVTMKASRVYSRNKLVFIAPISTASKLTGPNNPYIFRTNTNGDRIAQQLVDRLIDKERRQKVAIFHVPSVTYNQEFKTQFINKLTARGGTIVATFPFSTTTSSATSTETNFDAEASLAKANQMGAEAILVLPVGRYNREALKILKVRANKYPNFSVIGDTALYSFSTLKAGNEAKDLTLSVPWQESESTPQFSTGASQLWNTQVNWATATSYNAVKALGAAIKSQEQPSRAGIMKILSENEFMGASGRFQFTKGEPTAKQVLVRVSTTPPNYKYSSRTGYDFVTLD
jgi:ABC-type branched-subunit amino acid transport system substrate-binding protein/serine/threonine protein kinase